MNYYNEWDPQAAAWLRELIAERLIPRGLVDERSITEVKAEDLEGFTQCHFFAGIGGWPLALQLAGVSHKTRLWTGSPPCQPFSAAGKQLGQFDPRHLAPVFLRLISQRRPPVLFGEQVAPAIAKSWMCDLQTHLEGEDYAVGFAVLPACGVGAPHKRDRLFFGAHNPAESLRAERDGERLHGLGESNQTQGSRTAAEPTGRGYSDRMADGDDDRQQSGSRRKSRRESPCPGDDVGRGGTADKLADTDGERIRRRPGEGVGEARKVEGREEQRQRVRVDSGAECTDLSDQLAHTSDSSRLPSEPRAAERGLPQGAEKDAAIRANSHYSFWSDADWLGCRDGKFRPVEPDTFPLANGIPARVGRLRGYGNAIVPQVAAEFITAFMGAAGETLKD